MIPVIPSLGEPESLGLVTDTGSLRLQNISHDVWQGGGACVSTHFNAATASLHISLQSEVPVRHLELRWRAAFAPDTRFLGDAWERGYGDLQWQCGAAGQIFPWYFLAFDGQNTAAYGVQTGAGALCHWTVEAQNLTLHLDVRNGGAGVQLGERALDVAAVVFAASAEEPFAFARRFCRLLCPAPRLPAQPVYGGNDWYYAYGDNSRASVVRDAATLSELAPDSSNRPWMVIDDGWQPCREPWNGGPWQHGNADFGDMSEVARAIKSEGARPGLWFRPLLTALAVPASWKFAPRAATPPEGWPLDPSVPETLQLVANDVKRFREWGFELVKHDFSTFDIFWKWGFDFGDDPCRDAWHFADRSRTSAEIIRALYQTMRDAAGDEMLLLGCNTIGHLGAGIFEIQRTGDDTSGREWERTRKMGINTLAFRMNQHDAFFAVDADCVGLTNQIPWELNCQWLDLLAHSGTPLFVSAAPDALGCEQKSALRAAFARASRPQPAAEPLDWLDTNSPSLWRLGDQIRSYQWRDV